MESYFLNNDEPVSLGDIVSERGGEGIIYEIEGNSDLYAKIYKRPSSGKEMKLKVMVDMESPLEKTDDFRLAWPKGTLYNQDKNFVGFTMQNLNCFEQLNSCDLRNCWGTSRPQDYSWEHSVLAARNLSSLIEVLHSNKNDIIIGDLRPENVRIFENCKIALIDCDSFQFTYRGKVFPSPTGFPNYTPPEFQGVVFEETPRTKEADNFALAIIIFQLLMNGFNPFVGSLKQDIDPDTGKSHLSVPEKIKRVLCVYF